MSQLKREEFYQNLKVKLDENSSFPSQYLYKFIVPVTGAKSEEIISIFSNKNAKIATKESKTGKFVSVSIQMLVQSSDEVIVHYRSVEHIEGLISL